MVLQQSFVTVLGIFNIGLGLWRHSEYKGTCSYFVILAPFFSKSYWSWVTTAAPLQCAPALEGQRTPESGCRPSSSRLLKMFLYCFTAVWLKSTSLFSLLTCHWLHLSVSCCRAEVWAPCSPKQLAFNVVFLGICLWSKRKGSRSWGDYSCSQNSFILNTSQTESCDA